jgi:nicotinic acid mononucleotide adenylyltransferase
MGPDAVNAALRRVIAANGWRLPDAGLSEISAPVTELDAALRLALGLARVRGTRPVAAWHEPLFTEARRRLYPRTFPAPTPEAARVSEFFFPLAAAVLEEQAAAGGSSIHRQLPFVPLAEEEIARWPSGAEYRRMLRHVGDDALLVTLALAQQWLGLSIYDHVLGVTGLSLWIGRQLARVVPVDLPLLHGAAIGHDVGKFGCIGDEVERIPRLHYYYTHTWYHDRDLLSLGHIATNHSCWDLEQVRLPIETLLLIYADFRVKEWPDASGRQRMQIISLHDAFAAIRDKLENLDHEKVKRYRGVFSKLRGIEEYLQFLGVELNPPGFPVDVPPAPRLPEGLDIVAVLAGAQRPDAVALASGRALATVRRLFATAHNLGVMERLRDLPALRALLEEARSFERWRDLRPYLAILSEYSPALSREQKTLALDFFIELLSHRDDDIRYHAANAIADLLSGEEEFWRKDLPSGIELVPERTSLDELERVLGLLDRAGGEPDEDMGPSERVLYAIPIMVRRLLRDAGPELRERAWERLGRVLAGRRSDGRALVGLYVCETLEVSLEWIPASAHDGLVAFAEAWMEHESESTRLMAWRLLLALVRQGRDRPQRMASIRACVERLGEQLRRWNLVAELFMLQELAVLAGLDELAERCRKERVGDRDPVREVFLRNLKSRVGWVEKKVSCDYLADTAELRREENRDPGAYFANEVAAHYANLLKVSRVEGARFHAGRCLLRVLPLLTVPQRNDLMVELLRSLELDVEAVTRYIPRFLGAVLASLPEQEFVEALDDIERNVRRGSESLQRLLLQTASWLMLSLEPARLEGPVLRRLTGMLLGALAESRGSTAVEGFAQIGMVLERLSRLPRRDPRLRMFLALATKKVLALVTHRPSDRVRFFLIASALNHLERAFARVHPRLAFRENPLVAFTPGTFDPFTEAHAAIVARTLESADEAMVQIDDYSWRKHALPRAQREELAWMALAAVPEAFLAPFRPPVNIASAAGLRILRRAFGARPLALVVGSDVLAGASAYGNPESAIWDIQHTIVVREDATDKRWRERIGCFRRGVSVLTMPAWSRSVSSTSLREALDRHEELEHLCHPLVARTLVEGRLYVNYPAAKASVEPPETHLRVEHRAGTLPAGLRLIASLGQKSRPQKVRTRRTLHVLDATAAGGRPLAALRAHVFSAAAIPVVVGERALLPAATQLVGEGALVEALALADVTDAAALHALLADSMAAWLHDGLLFTLVPLAGPGGAMLREALRQHGACVGAGDGGEQGALAAIRLINPRVLVWDLEGLLHSPYAESPVVRRALTETRAALAAFFAALAPGTALLHVREEHWKRRVVEWAQERLREEGRARRWVVLGLGRQFSRDIVGDVPTVALDLERYLTWQGHDAGLQPQFGSPALAQQLAVARELGSSALLLAPLLERPEAVADVVAEAQPLGLRVRGVLVGVTNAATCAALELSGIPHRCGVIVPGWQGVLRESAVAPYLGGWSIVGRRPLELGSLLPSLNDCLPYHYPHDLGLDESAALDFSRLALASARRLLRALEEVFRAREGLLLSVRDLGAVVRTPRCPPLPEGFVPPRERLPSHAVADDLEALARMHPETHSAHKPVERGL